MPRPLRLDPLDAFLHVFGRGINSRPLFENDDEIRVFLSLLARAVKEGWIEVHQFSVLTTHFHLLIRSRSGQLSKAMHWIEGMYAAYVNRVRNRRGPVFESRFHSKVIRSSKYWLAVVIYIDDNPVQAGIVEVARDYPYGSANRYAQRTGPIWLERSSIESFVCRQAGLSAYDPAYYPKVLGARSSRGLQLALRTGLYNPSFTIGPFEDLLRAAPAHVQRWLVETARKTDGSPAGIVLLDPRTVQEIVEDLRREEPARRFALGRRNVVDPHPILEAGLLRGVAGLPLAGVGRRLGLSASGVHRRIDVHLSALAKVEDYRALAARAVAAGLERDYAPLLALRVPLPPQLPSLWV